MSQEIKHYCDICHALISHHDVEDGMQVYGVKVEGSLNLGFDRKTNTGSSSTPHTYISGGEFCSTACAIIHLNRQVEMATSRHLDWTSGVTEQ